MPRASSSVIGNNAANWGSKTPTPGAANLGVVTNAVISTTSPLPGVVVGIGYTNTFAATGGSTPYSWSITSGSVPGLSLATNGILSGTPALAGTNIFTVQLADNIGFATNKQFTLVVVTTAPSMTTASLTNGTLGAAYSQTLTAAGGTSPYSWSLASGALPGGLTLNSAGVISGTPATNGTFSFTAQLADAYGLTASSLFSLTIVAAPLAITTVSPMSDGTQGNYYSQALTGAGGIMPYSWSLAGGALPPGLSLDNLGDITGTSTNLGTFNFTARVTDNLGTSVTKLLAISIVSPTVSITTATLPDGTVGAAYLQSLAASGGTPPYSWSIVWGALPAGLNLSSAGAVSGTPTNGGTFSFIAQVADNASVTAQQIFTVAIQNNPPGLSVLSATNGTIQLLITGDGGANYSIESSAELLEWEARLLTNAPAMPFRWTDPRAADGSARFYRVWLSQ